MNVTSCRVCVTLGPLSMHVETTAAVLTKRRLQEDEQLQVQHGSKEGQVMDELPATPPELAQVQGYAKQQPW